MPIHSTRNGNSGRISDEWHANKPGQPIHLEEGGGERSKPALIEKNVAKVVKAEQGTATATQLAEYILEQVQINPRLNAIAILNKSKLKAPLRIRIAAVILYKLKQRELEENQEDDY